MILGLKYSVIILKSAKSLTIEYHIISNIDNDPMIKYNWKRLPALHKKVSIKDFFIFCAVSIFLLTIRYNVDSFFCMKLAQN